jgi:Phage integrase family/Phage integrase, N-terminal SAM-like domain
VRPNHVLVNGKAEHHQEGFYSIEWYAHGRRRRQAVGKEASEAQAALDRHLHRLRGLALGFKAEQEAPEPKRCLAEACGEFLDLYRSSTGRKVKTYQSYRMALEQFKESCPKRCLEEIDRRDLQHFIGFLMNKKEHDPRTAHDKLAVVAQFLKANNVPRRGQPDRHFLRTLKLIAWTAGLNCGFCKTDIGLCRQGPTCERWFLHKFRATYATMQLQGGVDLRTLQVLLGHKDLASTMRYLKPARNERVLQQVNSIFCRLDG